MTTTPTLHLGVPTQAGPLTVFPVWTDAPLPQTALRARLPRRASVDELASESVQRLKVHNPTPKPFLLPGGSIFDGGLQHRALVQSVVVDAESDLTIDVRCVEQGRWGGQSSQRLHRRRAPLAVRGALRGVSAHRRTNGGHGLVHADQSDVWTRVSRYELSMGDSPTSSLVEVTDRLDGEADQLAGDVRPLLGQRGVLIGIGGHPAILEVFDHPRTLADQWEAILTSVLADARLVAHKPTTGARARTFAHHVSARHLTNEARGGIAVNASARDDLAVIDATVAKAERIVHLAALNARHVLVGAG